jgi:hypothetical protein
MSWILMFLQLSSCFQQAKAGSVSSGCWWTRIRGLESTMHWVWYLVIGGWRGVSLVEGQAGGDCPVSEMGIASILPLSEITCIRLLPFELGIFYRNCHFLQRECHNFG